VSTERGDDVDSVSVTTSSSSEVTAAVTGRRDRGVGLPAPAAGARPKHPLPPHAPNNNARDPLAGSVTRPTYFQQKRCAHDNDAFVGDDQVVKAADDIPYHPLQQRQPATDAHTHCVSVELHKAPREFAAATAPDTGNVSMI